MVPLEKQPDVQLTVGIGVWAEQWEAVPITGAMQNVILICDLKTLTQSFIVHGTLPKGFLFPSQCSCFSSLKLPVFYYGFIFQFSLKNDFEPILHSTPTV